MLHIVKTRTKWTLHIQLKIVMFSAFTWPHVSCLGIVPLYNTIINPQPHQTDTPKPKRARHKRWEDFWLIIVFILTDESFSVLDQRVITYIQYNPNLNGETAFNVVKRAINHKFFHVNRFCGFTKVNRAPIIFSKYRFSIYTINCNLKIVFWN